MAENKNAYAIFDMLPPPSDAGISMEEVCDRMSMSQGGVHRILKLMQAHNIATSSLGDSLRRVKAFWWRAPESAESRMEAVFGRRPDSTPRVFGRYASVWHYGQGVVY